MEYLSLSSLWEVMGTNMINQQLWLHLCPIILILHVYWKTSVPRYLCTWESQRCCWYHLGFKMSPSWSLLISNFREHIEWDLSHLCSKIASIKFATFYACSVIQLCLTLCNPMDYNPLGYPVHGVSQARIMEWVAISFSRESSQPRDQICISCGSWIGRGILLPEINLSKLL